MPSDGKVVACEYDAFAAAFAQKHLQNSPHGDKVEIVLGDAGETLARLAKQQQQFDLVFLDADKQNYTRYYQWLMEAELVKKGGLICVDNTLYMGQVYRKSPHTANGIALHAFNEMVQEDTRVKQVVLPLRDGLTLIRRMR